MSMKQTKKTCQSQQPQSQTYSVTDTHTLQLDRVEIQYKPISQEKNMSIIPGDLSEEEFGEELFWKTFKEEKSKKKKKL